MVLDSAQWYLQNRTEERLEGCTGLIWYISNEAHTGLHMTNVNTDTAHSATMSNSSTHRIER